MTVSVIVPAFNAAAYVAEALASLQAQAGVALEILVVDDGSRDATAAIVADIAAADPRVRLLSGEHRGVAAARNRGLLAASGDYITFLDADDLCAPGRIQRQRRVLEDKPDITVVIGELFLFEALTADFQPLPGTRFGQTLGVSLTTALFRRPTFDAIGPFDETLEYCEDLDFYLRLIEADARFLIETEVATYYRRHGTNMTNDRERLAKGHVRLLHRSLQRRRLSGEKRELQLFFFKLFRDGTVFQGLKP